MQLEKKNFERISTNSNMKNLFLFCRDVFSLEILLWADKVWERNIFKKKANAEGLTRFHKGVFSHQGEILAMIFITVSAFPPIRVMGKLFGY